MIVLKSLLESERRTMGATIRILSDSLAAEREAHRQTHSLLADVTRELLTMKKASDSVPVPEPVYEVAPMKTLPPAIQKAIEARSDPRTMERRQLEREAWARLAGHDEDEEMVKRITSEVLAGEEVEV